MSGEQADPNTDQITALTAGDFLGWYEEQAAELDAEAALLQEQVATNPALADDPVFREREAHLIGRKELLDKAGEDFSQHTYNKKAEFIIRQTFGDTEEQADNV
jgi:hypothetical protein